MNDCHRMWCQYTSGCYVNWYRIAEVDFNPSDNRHEGEVLLYTKSAKYVIPHHCCRGVLTVSLRFPGSDINARFSDRTVQCRIEKFYRSGLVQLLRHGIDQSHFMKSILLEITCVQWQRWCCFGCSYKVQQPDKFSMIHLIDNLVLAGSPEIDSFVKPPVEPQNYMSSNPAHVKKFVVLWHLALMPLAFLIQFWLRFWSPGYKYTFRE